MSAAQAEQDKTSTPAPADEVTAIRGAQAELERAVSKAALSNDPLRYAFGGLSAALGAFLAGIEATRRPLDPSAQAAMVKQAAAAAADGARREVSRLALATNRRFAFLAGLGVSLAIVGSCVVGYAYGRAEEATRTAMVSEALAPSLRDGSASARAWLDLMRNNDLLAALRRCEGRSVSTDAAGRRACAIPLWLDPPSATPAIPGRS